MLVELIHTRFMEAIRRVRREDAVASRSTLLVTAYPGQAAVADLEHLAATGKRPRKDYVEIARALDADVIDFDFMQHRAHPIARAVARHAGLTAGQVCEAFLRSRRSRHIVAWADRIGLPLALLHKLTRSRRDLVLMSAWLSLPKKAVFLKRLRVDSHLEAIINYSSVQMAIAARELAVPDEKLHLAKQPVDDRFWRPQPPPSGGLICAVGWEARDYTTLIQAVSGLDLHVHIAVGIAGLSSSRLETSSIDEGAGRSRDSRSASRFAVLRGTFSYDVHHQWMERVADEGLPPNVTILEQLVAEQLRALYARAQFVVIPLLDVDSDCGVTSITEAMAMGKAVVVSRTRGQVDIVRDGEHGLYVRPGDPSALRAAIEYLVAHREEAERMGRAGREEVERHYALDGYAARVTDIIRGAGSAPDSSSRRRWRVATSGDPDLRPLSSK